MSKCEITQLPETLSAGDPNAYEQFQEMGNRMTHPLRLLCVLAHPDDETLGTGGLLARYSSTGIETFVVTATRGEKGRYSLDEQHPGSSRAVRSFSRMPSSRASSL